MNISLSFISDDGIKIEKDMYVFVQDKESGFYSKYPVTDLMLERRLGLVDKELSWMYGDEIPIHWNYFYDEEKAIERKKHIESNGPDKKIFLPKTIILK